MKISIVLLGFLASFTFSAYGAEKNTEVIKLPDGWYQTKPPARLDENNSLIYEVDTKTQLCFISWYGHTLIPCSNLKRRPEWKDIITWG